MRLALSAQLALLLGLWGCAGPRLPEVVTISGQELKKASEWKREGVQSVVFIAKGESMRSAPLQIGVLTSTEHKTARELSVWLLRQYRSAPVSRAHEEADEVTACKVGASATPPRSFVAVHVCRDSEGFSACVEADAQLTPSMHFGAGDLPMSWEALADRVVTQR